MEREKAACTRPTTGLSAGARVLLLLSTYSCAVSSPSESESCFTPAFSAGFSFAAAAPPASELPSTRSRKIGLSHTGRSPVENAAEKPPKPDMCQAS
eukprot:scaffold3541_cov57-Phaeocystis_antarctica.AAC.4